MMDDRQDLGFLLLMALAVTMLLVLFFATDTPPQSSYDIHPIAREALFNRMYRTCEIINHSADVNCADVVNEVLHYRLEQARLCNVQTAGRDTDFEACLVENGVVIWQP